MKKLISILVIIASIYGCKKSDNEIFKFKPGTFKGEKTIYYPDTQHESSDTITIKFDSTSYTYSGSDPLDFGRGKFLIQNSSIEFKDDEARIALYSWEWILGGVYKFQIIDDQMILNQYGSHLQISCRLRKIPE
jgi:hypothetical protein